MAAEAAPRRRGRPQTAAWQRAVRRYIRGRRYIERDRALEPDHPRLRTWALDYSPDLRFHAAILARLNRRRLVQRFERVPDAKKRPLLALVRTKIRRRRMDGHRALLLAERLTIDAPVTREALDLPIHPYALDMPTVTFPDASEDDGGIPVIFWIEAWLGETFWPRWITWCVTLPPRPEHLGRFLSRYQVVRDLLVEFRAGAGRGSLLKVLTERVGAAGGTVPPHGHCDSPSRCLRCQGFITLPPGWRRHADTPAQLARLVLATHCLPRPTLRPRALATCYRQVEEELAAARDERAIAQHWARYAVWLAAHPDAGRDLLSHLGIQIPAPA